MHTNEKEAGSGEGERETETENIYIYIYIERERERERKRQTETQIPATYVSARCYTYVRILLYTLHTCPHATHVRSRWRRERARANERE